LTNPFGPAVNGSLWTLFYEVACYAMAAVIGLLGLRFFTAFLCVYGAAYVVLRSTGPHALLIDLFRQLSLPFVAGMTFFHFREKMKLWWLAFGALGLVVLGHQREIFILAWSSLAILAGYLPWGMFYNRLGDYSYGIYIYAFPVEQSVAHVLKPIPPLPLAIISFSFTGALAVLSWHIIEHRSLLIRPMLRDAIIRIYARAWLLHRVPSAPSHRRSA
jgi:peptidoglycan/LPS O-acetylase OafA/YrhL